VPGALMQPEITESEARQIADLIDLELVQYLDMADTGVSVNCSLSPTRQRRRQVGNGP
jgi:hypothetical protein